ncbi:MAG: hypothetical protein SGJ10_04495 [Bacteroidota bacterium]|nr:hypothetical protein [Bacteroidota bacterium]
MQFKKILGLTLFTLYFNLFSVCQSFTFQKVINTKVKKSSSEYKKPITSFSNNKLYFVDFASNNIDEVFNSDSVIKIYRFNTTKNKTDSLRLSFKYNGFDLEYTGGWFTNFYVSWGEKYIFINNHTNIIVLKKKSSGEYRLYKKIARRYYYQEIKQLSNEDFLFLFCYNSHPLNQKEKVVLSIYNIHSDTVSKSIFPHFDGIAYSSLIHNWIEVIDKKIILSNTLDYKIKVYDMNLKLTDSLIRIIPSWTKYENEKTSTHNTKQIIENIYESDQTNYRIEKIIPYNKASFIVSYKTGLKKDVRQIDFVKIENKSLVVSDSNIKISTIELAVVKDTIKTDSRPFPELIYSNDIYSNGKYIYVILSEFCPYQINETYGSMIKKCDSYAKENVINWGVLVFKYIK